MPVRPPFPPHLFVLRDMSSINGQKALGWTAQFGMRIWLTEGYAGPVNINR